MSAHMTCGTPNSTTPGVASSDGTTHVHPDASVTGWRGPDPHSTKNKTNTSKAPAGRQTSCAEGGGPITYVRQGLCLVQPLQRVSATEPGICLPFKKLKLNDIDANR